MDSRLGESLWRPAFAGMTDGVKTDIKIIIVVRSG
jgi:hypothetical protein